MKLEETMSVCVKAWLRRTVFVGFLHEVVKSRHDALDVVFPAWKSGSFYIFVASNSLIRRFCRGISPF